MLAIQRELRNAGLTAAADDIGRACKALEDAVFAIDDPEANT